MTDPFHDLRRTLVGAAARQATVPRRRRRRRGLMAAAAALVIASGTAAAAIIGGEEPSLPLAGPVLGSTDTRYAVEIAPDLRPGSVGWCTFVRFRSSDRPLGYGGGCGAAASRGATVISAGTTVTRPRHAIAVAIVPERVARLRTPDGRLIIPSPSPMLPRGWRAAVSEVRYTPKSATRVLGADNLVPVDRQGHPLQAANPLPTTSPSAGPRCKVIGGPKPRSVTAAGARPARAGQSFEGRAFRSCWHASYRDGLEAALLVDAEDPTRRAAELPGSRPLADGRVVANGRLLARRSGAGWLVVRGPSDSRARLLTQLRVAS